MKDHTPSKEMNSFLDDLAILLNKYKADLTPCKDGKSIRVEMDGEMAEFVAVIENCDCKSCHEASLAN